MPTFFTTFGLPQAMRELIIVTGQTATGKTRYALSRAQNGTAALINADSRQMYRQISITTGKDIEPHDPFTHVTTLNSARIGFYSHNGIHIWLYDLMDPCDTLSPVLFRRCADFVIAYLHNLGVTPIVVGGSYYYLQHLLYHMPSYGGADYTLREELKNEPVSKLQILLSQEAPDVYHTLNESDRLNPHRLIRRLEIVRGGSQYRTVDASMSRRSERLRIIGFKHQSRELMKKRIAQRVENRIRNGAISEVERLVKMGYPEDCPGYTSIGCLELSEFIRGRISQQEAVERWIQHEYQYAKRQFTLMKRDDSIHWHEV